MLSLEFNNLVEPIIKELEKDNPEHDVTKCLLAMEEVFRKTGYRKMTTGDIPNILIVRLDKIGDMIMTSGFIREVRKNYPLSRITLVVSESAYDIIKFCPYVNEVLIFPHNFTMKDSVIKIIKTTIEFCKHHLWDKNFYLSFSPRWCEDVQIPLLICYLSGAIDRVGYGTYPYTSWLEPPVTVDLGYDNFILTHNITTPTSVVSMVDKSFYLLEAIGAKVESRSLEMFLNKSDKLKAEELLSNITNKKVALSIGGSSNLKKYPVKKYLVAMRELLSKYDITIIIVGSKEEINDARYLESNLPKKSVLNLVGKNTIRETAAVIGNCDILISNDTCTVHMASAQHVPVVGLYRVPKDKDMYWPGVFNESLICPPYQTNFIMLRPEHSLPECKNAINVFGYCIKDHRGKPHCITQIDPKEIVKAVETLRW